MLHFVGANSRGEGGRGDVPPSAVSRLILGDLNAWKPGPVSIFGGIAYIADVEQGRVIAFSVYTRQAVNLPGRWPEGGASAILATEEALFLSSREEQPLYKTQRLVPVEFSVAGEPSSASFVAGFFEQLQKRSALPLAEFSYSEQLVAVLSAEKRFQQKGEVDFTPLFCVLNPALCEKGKPKAVIAAGERVLLPTLSEEVYIDSEQLTLGGVPVARMLEGLIVSEVLDAWKAPAQIARMNPSEGATAPEELLRRSKGTLRLPTERFRYITVLAPRHADAVRRPGTVWRRRTWASRSTRSKSRTFIPRARCSSLGSGAEEAHARGHVGADAEDGELAPECGARHPQH